MLTNLFKIAGFWQVQIDVGHTSKLAVIEALSRYLATRQSLTKEYEQQND
jgi:hypothetical protein